MCKINSNLGACSQTLFTTILILLISISLDWPLSAQVNPFFGRQPFHHEIYTKHPRCVNDDVWTFNTQSSSQWDGLRHFAYQDERVFYGGRGLLEFGLEEAAASDSRSSVAKRNVGSSVLGISAMAQKGIVGRGVLVDWEGWRAANEPGYEPEVFGSRTRLGLDELKRVLEWQGTQVRFGDLLFVRSGVFISFLSISALHWCWRLRASWTNANAAVGYLRTFKTTSQHTIDPLTKASPPSFIGVAQNEEMACWLWENFSAVAGDMPAFEAFRVSLRFFSSTTLILFPSS